MAVLVACVVLFCFRLGRPLFRSRNSLPRIIRLSLTKSRTVATTSFSGLEEASGDEFEQLGIDPKEYAKTYLEGFDYKIGDVTVDEDKEASRPPRSLSPASL